MFFQEGFKYQIRRSQKINTSRLGKNNMDLRYADDRGRLNIDY